MTSHMIKLDTTETQFTVADLKPNTVYRCVNPFSLIMYSSSFSMLSEVEGPSTGITHVCYFL